MSSAQTVSGSAPRRDAATAARSVRIALLLVSAVTLFAMSTGPLLQTKGLLSLAGVAYLLLTLVLLGSGWWVLRNRPLPMPFVYGALATMAVVVVAMDSVLAPGDYLGPAHWSFGVIGWMLLLLLADQPLAAAIVTLSLYALVSAGLFVAGGTPDRTALGLGMITVVSVTAFQLAVGVVAVTIYRRHALQALAEANERQRLIMAKAIADELDQENQARLLDQLGGALPLLVWLADADPGTRTEAARRSFAAAATRLRRLFAENDETPDPLVHELAACADSTERRGLSVSLLVSGAAETPVDLPVRRALAEPVIATLALARTSARITVLRGTDCVRVAVVADHDGTEATFTSAEPVTVHCVTMDNQIWMEARWDRPSPG